MLNHKIMGEGPPLVILHGLFGMLDNWQTLGREWAEHYRVVLVDLPNHGRSPHTEVMDYDTMAEAVAQLLETLTIDECYLLGHSMGGKVAMHTALTYPGLVKKLVVVDIAPRAYRRGHDDIFAALQTLDPAALADRTEASDQLAIHLPDPGVQLFLLKNLARKSGGGFKWRMNLPVIFREYDKLVGSVGNPGATFAGPTLFLRGGRSGYVRDEDWPDILELFPAAQLATVENAGHWVHAEQAAATQVWVSDFLAE